MRLLLRGARVIDPASGVDGARDILIEDGRIALVDVSIAPSETGHTTVVDLGPSLVVCPGFIDMHVHLREPGYEHKETVASGAASGAGAVQCPAGGLCRRAAQCFREYPGGRAAAGGHVASGGRRRGHCRSGCATGQGAAVLLRGDHEARARGDLRQSAGPERRARPCRGAEEADAARRRSAVRCGRRRATLRRSRS